MFLAFTLGAFNKKQVAIKEDNIQVISLTSFQNKLQITSQDASDNKYFQKVIFKPIKHQLVFEEFNNNKSYLYKVYMSEQVMNQYQVNNLSVLPETQNLYNKLQQALNSTNNDSIVRFDYYNPTTTTNNTNTFLIVLGALSFIMPIWFIYNEIKCNC